MFDLILCALTNLFRIFLIDRFVSVFLGKNEDKKYRKIVVCACFFIINTALYWEFHTVWINVVCNLLGISAIVGLYTKSVKTNIFVTCSVYLVNCGCDVAVYGMFIDIRDGAAYEQVYGVITFFLILICELLIEKIITVRKSLDVAPNFPLMLVPICSIAVIVFFTYSDICTDRGAAVISIGMLMINFLMLYQYNMLVHFISQKYETEMLRQKTRIYANQLELIAQSEEKVKILRHDMKHHMNELKLMANRHGVTEIQEYIDNMEEYIQNPNEIVASGNTEIDSVLNYMLQKAREELDTVVIKAVLPERIRHTFGINVLIGNLLENAIEAARQTEQKYLNVNIALKKGVLKIRMENSFLSAGLVTQEERGSGSTFLTTKKEKGQHGIGLKSVRKIVEAYHGTMEVSSQKELFCVNLILYLPKEEKETSGSGIFDFDENIYKL